MPNIWSSFCFTIHGLTRQACDVINPRKNPRGGYSSMIWVGTCRWDLKSRPIFIPNFTEKWDPFVIPEPQTQVKMGYSLCAALKDPSFTPSSLKPPFQNFLVPQDPTFAWNHKFLENLHFKASKLKKISVLMPNIWSSFSFTLHGFTHRPAWGRPVM